MFSMVGTMPAASARSAKKRSGPSACVQQALAVLQRQARRVGVRRDGVDVGAAAPRSAARGRRSGGVSSRSASLSRVRSKNSPSSERIGPSTSSTKSDGQPARLEVGDDAVHRLGGREVGGVQVQLQAVRRGARAGGRQAASASGGPSAGPARSSGERSFQPAGRGRPRPSPVGAYPSSALARETSATRSPSSERPVGGTISERESIAAQTSRASSYKRRADAGRQVVHPCGGARRSAATRRPAGSRAPRRRPRSGRAAGRRGRSAARRAGRDPGRC